MIGYNRQLTSHFDTSTLHLPQLDGYVQTAPLLCSFPLDPELRALLKCSSCCYSENQSLVSLFLKKALPEHCYYYSALSSSYYQNIVPCQCCKQPSLSGFWTDDALFTIFCATGNLSDWWNVVHFTCRKVFYYYYNYIPYAQVIILLPPLLQSGAPDVLFLRFNATSSSYYLVIAFYLKHDV